MTRLLAILRNGLVASMALFVVACDSGTSFEPSREVPFSARVGGGTPTTPTTTTTPSGGTPTGLTAASSICDSIYKGMSADGNCVLLNALDDDDNPRFVDDGYTRESLCYGAGSGSEKGEALVYDPSTEACVEKIRGCPDGEGIITSTSTGMRCSGQAPAQLTSIKTIVVRINHDDDAADRQTKIDTAIAAERRRDPSVALINVVEVHIESGSLGQNKIDAAEKKANGDSIEDIGRKFVFRTIAVGIEPGDMPAERLAKIRKAIAEEQETIDARSRDTIIDVIEVFYDDGDTQEQKDAKREAALRQAGEGTRFDAQFVIATAVVGVEPGDTPEEREDKAIVASNAKRAEVPNASLIDIIYVVFDEDDIEQESDSQDVKDAKQQRRDAKIAAAELAAERGDIDEVTELRRAQTTYSVTTCTDAGRVLQINGGRGSNFLRGVSCADQCEDGTFLGDGSGQRNKDTCYNPLACATLGGGRAERGDGNCVAASAESCYGMSGDSASARYYYNGERCGQDICGANLGMTRTTSATAGTNTCVTLGACYDTYGRIRGRSGRCVAGINLCMNALGMGYDGDKCVAASNESCDSTISALYNGQCVRTDCPAGEITDARRFGACVKEIPGGNTKETQCTSNPNAALNYNDGKNSNNTRDDNGRQDPNLAGHDDYTICVSKQGGCRVGEGVERVLRVRDQPDTAYDRCTTTANAATCHAAERFIDSRGGTPGCYDSCGGRDTVTVGDNDNVCVSDCPTGQVYSVTRYQCVAINIDDNIARQITRCTNLGQLVNVDINGCVHTCDDGQVEDAKGERCISEATATQIMQCTGSSQLANVSLDGCVEACGNDQVVDANRERCISCFNDQVLATSGVQCISIVGQCTSIGRLLGADLNSCVKECGDDGMLDANRTRCIDVAATRKGCLADGEAFDPDDGACVGANTQSCARIGATFASERCQEMGDGVARITFLRGEAALASAGSDGKVSTAVGLLRTAMVAITADTVRTVTVQFGSDTELLLFRDTSDDATMTTADMIGNRLRVLYANQPSLDQVGAAFAFNANDGFNYGAGATISYITPVTPLGTDNGVPANTILAGRAAANFRGLLGAGRTGVFHDAVSGAGEVPHYASFIDSGTLAVEIVGARNRGRNEADIGLLALINGMVDVSDSAIDNILTLKKATHSIAPAANLNVQVTGGFEPIRHTFDDGGNDVKTFQFIDGTSAPEQFQPGHPSNVDFAVENYLPQLQGDVDLYRAIMNSGARPSQVQGNVILLDNRMAAASDTPTVLALRDPNYLRDYYDSVALDYDPAGFLDNTWRIKAKSDLTEGFNQDLDRYLAPGGYLTRFSNSLAPTKYFNGVYSQTLKNTPTRDNIIRVPGGSSVSLRNEDLTAAIIEGLYGRGTEIYPTTVQGNKPGVIKEDDGRFTRAELLVYNRIGNKLNVIDAIIDTMKARAATGRDMDALIFAARDGNARDIGLFAGLPIYIDRIRRTEDGTVQSPLPYYLAVVAAESGQTPCGYIARDYCIAAPGTYRYATAGDATLQTETSANAAASLVAGGVALMQDIFAGQLNTAEIIARIKSTASRNFDVDSTAGNDYDRDVHGHGMLDLACATQVLTQRERCRPDPDATDDAVTQQSCLERGLSYNGSQCFPPANQAHCDRVGAIFVRTITPIGSGDRTNSGRTFLPDLDSHITDECVPRMGTVAIPKTVESEQDVIALFEDAAPAYNATPTDTQKLAREYQNQPSLSTVGASAAYARGVRGNLVRGDNLVSSLNLGQDSQISYVTNTVFDPTHPEFSSSAADASYDVLARFRAVILDNEAGVPFGEIGESVEVSGNPGTFAFTVTDSRPHARLFWRSAQLLESDLRSGRQARVYRAESDTFNTYFTVSLGQDIQKSRSDFSTDEDSRTALRDFLRGILGGTAVFSSHRGGDAIWLASSETGEPLADYTGLVGTDGYGIVFQRQAVAGAVIPIDSDDNGVTYVGRVYAATSNIESHQIVIDPTVQLQNADGSDTAIIAELFGVRDAADMGVMALINGLINPTASTDAATYNSNTHGIAPGARLSVFSTPKLGTDKSTPVDLIARARGIDLGHNNENPERNIVLLSNTIVADDGAAVTLGDLIDAVSAQPDNAEGENYRAVYKGLARGVIAPQRATDAQRGIQDIYVFAASDGRGDKRDGGGVIAGKNDAGLFASLAAARTIGSKGDIEHSIFRDYSIVVVAVENYQSYAGATSWTKNSPCGAYVQAFCIAAPGAYKYRGISAGDYQESLSDRVSANAAASLVAGGLALLESVFGTQLSSDALVARLLATASQDFDLSGATGNTKDGNNDYADEADGLTKEQRFGVGLLDLECASRPTLSASDPRCRPRETQTPGECLQAGQGYDDVRRGCVVMGDVTVNDCVRAGGLLDTRPEEGASTRCVTRTACGDDVPLATAVGNARHICAAALSPPMACKAEGKRYQATIDECVTSCSGTTPLFDVDKNTCVVRCANGYRDDDNELCVSMAELLRGDTDVLGDLADTAGVNDDSHITDRIRREYANQPSLDVVGAAFAYNEAAQGLVDIATIGDTFGKGSVVNVITDKRFDPMHPEFSTSKDGASFETLTRFLVVTQSANEAEVITNVFNSNRGKARVGVYSDGFEFENLAYVTIRVKDVNNGVEDVAFEKISRDDLDGSPAIRAALDTFFDSIVAGDETDATMGLAVGADPTSGYFYGLDNDDANEVNYLIELTSAAASGDLERFQHLGRFYASGNLRSYQIVMDTSSEVRADDDSGDDYASDVPGMASAAEMGILALINGLANPGVPGIGYNTHGIAPAATLNVFTSPAVGKTGHNSADLIYRARGIDVGRDIHRGDLTSDDTRNIVVIQNALARAERTEAATVNNVDDVVGARRAIDNHYKAIYDALRVGLAETASDIEASRAIRESLRQDFYVFAAQDGGEADVGLLAGLPIATDSGFKEYSIIVVAVEDGQTPCGADTVIQSICIAAPGTYTYREHAPDGTYERDLTTATTAISANAAASLVAGGLALLQSIFPTNDTSVIVDRLLLTASKVYDLKGTGADDLTFANDFTAEKHGKGLMDLACAVRPIFDSRDPRRGCENRNIQCRKRGTVFDPTIPKCVTATAPGCARDGGRGFDSVNEVCVVASSSSCMGGGVRFNDNDSDPLNPPMCEIACDPGYGLDTSGVCVAVSGLSGLAAQVEACQRVGRLFNDSGRGACVNTGANCPGGGIRGRAGLLASNRADSEFQCIAQSVCVDDNNHGVRSRTCVDADAVTCREAGRTYDGLTDGCVAACPVGTLTRHSGTKGNECVSPEDCRDTAHTSSTRGAVRVSDMNCIVANGANCTADEMRFYDSSVPGCVEDEEACSGHQFGDSTTGENLCTFSSLTNVAVGTGIGIGDSEPIIDTYDEALDLFTGSTSGNTTAAKIATEYNNQPTLADVGAAQAYVSRVATSGADVTNLGQLKIGNGSHISVITNRRFDPNHPEFSSSVDGANFRTLTRFRVEDKSGNDVFVGEIPAPVNVLNLFFRRDTEELVETYKLGADQNDAFLTISVGTINGMRFEDISRTDFVTDDDAGKAIRNAVQRFFGRIVGGGDFIKNGRVIKTDNDYNYNLDTEVRTDNQREIIVNSGGNYIIRLFDESNARLSFTHLGRIYDLGGNLVSYQIVIHPNTYVREDGDEGECTADEECYDDSDDSQAPAAASAAEMGVLALINGMLDGAGGTANTHGIAPGATLKVITGNQFGDDDGAGEDAIYRARGIDVARDRDGSNNIIADPNRNIVIIQNGLVNTARTEAVTMTNIDDVIGLSGSLIFDSYEVAFEALNQGVEAPAADDTTDVQQRKAQDIYVFAAQDGRATEMNPGLLASLPVATSSNFKAYSVVVVAAEDDANAFCGTLTADLCLAAPGSYAYRTRDGNGRYTSTTLVPVTTPTSNAAASLVAGGLAILEDIFGSQMGSDELVARMLATTSQCFNFDDVTDPAWDGSSCTNSKNDFVGDKDSPDTTDFQTNRYGQGLMDLECATKTSLTQTRCRNAIASTSAPQQKPKDDPIPTGSAQGDKVEDDAAKGEKVEDDTAKSDTSIDYCDIDGLRIILSGDLCSSDYILLADKEGKLQPETIGNLRFGMGFGDALAGVAALGGITFFDAFDTAWTVDNPYNPYAHLLDISNIVIAPAQSRFDVEDRFSAMRYGTRPGTRKTWAADTARITMDFATQGMATKPYAVTRGQIRNTITHDNMGADPYADVRFMLSAEDTLGDGRLKVMTYSGMAMGYTLGLHSQGDAMMPSYLLTNRDSFHAPYLSLASSGLGGGMTYRFRDGGHIGFVMGEGTSLNADGTLPYQQQTERPRAFAGMMEYAPHKNLMFQMGALQEQSTLLASQGSGLFDIEGGATAFVGVQAKQRLADNWQALFSGYGGRTQLGGSRGIVSGLDVVTTSFDVGLLGSHLLERGDHVLLRAGQPMRVESGSLDLSYVSFRNKNRSSVSNVQRFDVAPSMRSVEFGIGYGMPIGRNGQGGQSGHVRFAIDYVLNPGHRRVQDEVFGIMSFRREF